MVRDDFRNGRRADEKSTFAAIVLSRACGVHLDIREPLTATMLPICWQGAGPAAHDKPRRRDASPRACTEMYCFRAPCAQARTSATWYITCSGHGRAPA